LFDDESRSTGPSTLVRWPDNKILRDRLLCLYLPFLIAVLLTFATTPDDAFITLRYAANLIHGYGLTFNPGQRVQGFTSPLGLGVAILVYALPGGLILFKMKLASMVFGLLAIREAALLIDVVFAPRWVSRVAYVVVGLCPVLAFASGNGLETTLEVWLLLALARRLTVDRRGMTLTDGVLAFFAVLARPDALVALTCMAITGFLVGREHNPVARIKWYLGAVVAAAASLAVQWAYFGSALPSTYYAKHLPLLRSMRLGLNYLSGLLQPVVFANRRHFSSIPIDSVNFIEAALFILGTIEIVRHRRALTYLVALVVGQALFIFWSGGEVFVGGRFLAPAAVPFILVELMGVLNLVRINGQYSATNTGHLWPILLTSLLLMTSVAPYLYERAPVSRIKGLTDASLVAASTEYTVGQVWLQLPSLLACMRPGELVATTEVGYLGFERLDLRILDMRGLTNINIARDTPSAMKGLGGVDELNWWQPASSVGRNILARHPAAIVEFDSVPTSDVLGGKYRLVRTEELGVQTIGVYVPSFSRRSCLG